MPSATTWYSGPAVTLAAGTWLITAHATIRRGATTAWTGAARLWDGSAALASGSQSAVSINPSFVSIPLVALVVLGSSTTVTVQGWASVVSTTTLHHVDRDGSAGATRITAVQIA